MASEHFAFLSTIMQGKEPHSYKETVKSDKWVKAMNQEINALKENNTWEICSLLPGKRALTSKWVYKIKNLLNGKMDRYKARLAARGYNQVFGLDYCDSFSLVAKAAIVRIFLL